MADHVEQNPSAHPTGDHVFRYVGNSMAPLFTPLDQLRAEPVTFKDVRRGDVLVFTHPTRSVQVVHRVVVRQDDYLRTRGDNQSELDPFTLTELDELRRVTGIFRSNSLQPIANGKKGYQYARQQHLRILLGRILPRRLAVLLLLLINRVLPGLLNRILRKRLHIIHADGEGDTIQLLMLGKRRVGKRSSKEDDWELRHPFDTLLHHNNLP